MSIPPDFIEHERFIRALPTLTIIDHMARVRGKDGLDQPAFRLLLDLLKDDRFWVKLCSFDKISALPQAHVEGSLPYLDMVPFAQAVIEAAPDRVIWGTDWPHGNTFTPGRTPNEGDLLDLLAVIAPDKRSGNASSLTIRRACLVLRPITYADTRGICLRKIGSRRARERRYSRGFAASNRACASSIPALANARLASWIGALRS